MLILSFDDNLGRVVLPHHAVSLLPFAIAMSYLPLHISNISHPVFNSHTGLSRWHVALQASVSDASIRRFRRE